MNYNIKKILKNTFLKKLIKYISRKFQYNSFKGNFKNFNQINRNLTEYNSNKIIKKVLIAYKISSKKSYLIDRDGEVVNKKNQNFQLLDAISKTLKKPKINCVIDYGGSLANFYRNNSNYLKKLNIVWIVIDNEKICYIGKKQIKNNNIYFFTNLKIANQFLMRRNLKIDFFLFGSSIQYLKNFEKILCNIKLQGIKKIFIDRQPVLKSKRTKYVIQKTPFWNGNFSYAVKLYNYQHLINLFKKYDFYLVKKFEAFGDQFKDGEYKSFIFEKK